MSVRSAPQWLRVGLIVLAAGVCFLTVSHVRSRRAAEPRLLPAASAEARPLAAVLPFSGPRLPVPDDDARSSGEEPTIRTVAHQAAVPAVLPLAMLGAEAATFKLTAVTDEKATLYWPTAAGGEIRVPDSAIRLLFPAAPTGIKMTITRNDVVLPSSPFVVGDDKAVALTLPAGSRHVLNATITDGQNPTQQLGTVTILTPEAGGPAKPVLAKAYNNKYSNLDGVTLSTQHDIRVYGNYLRVEGSLDSSASPRVRLALFDARNTPATVVAQDVPAEIPPPDDGKWVAEVRPDAKLVPFGFKGLLLAYAASGAFADARISFTVVEDRVSATAPVITAVSKAGSADPLGTFGAPNTWLIPDKALSFSLKGTVGNLPSAGRPDSRMVLYQVDGANRRPIVGADGNGFPLTGTAAAAEWTAPVTVKADGDYKYVAKLVQGESASAESAAITVLVRTKGPSVVDLDPRNRMVGAGRVAVTVFFDREHPLDPATADEKSNYSINGLDTTAGEDPPLEAVFNKSANSVALTFKDYPNDGNFTIKIKKSGTSAAKSLKDIYGLSLEADTDAAVFSLTRSRLADSPAVRPGITGATGEYVPFPEFTKPRDVPDGFNPNDKVETRVARLYYYRDAHRVAQLINRKVKSYNRQGVDMQRQLADKARNDAEQRTIARQQAERAAIAKAQKTREKENLLQSAERSANTAMQELTYYRRKNPDADPATDAQIRALDSAVQSSVRKAQDLRAEVQSLRDQEVAANELAQQAEGQEKLAREEQFRREVAAAHADPDTYAAGVPGSNDPVEQVSVSVIGEGVLQLRGPLKGINIIRLMIDQIDSPVGQVRVSVHTVQINGEKANRMEVVAKHIQTNIDHARFLTMQSAEMLRKAVVQVAAQKAEEARGLYPGESQEERDQRYLYSFFGKDFIDELRAMDSEFLNSGNKLLSLHSMDTTSLSSALNLLALAKNSTRQEIFQRFEDMTQGELCQAEMNYLQAGTTCRTKHFPLPCRDPKFCALAPNAKFQSLKGFFDTQISHDDTMTPLQREFVRLAQIFKSRLVTELEYKQRVMERAVIEERGSGKYMEDLDNARRKERAAVEEAERSRKTQAENQRIVLERFTQLAGTIRALANEAERTGATLASLKSPYEASLRQIEMRSPSLQTKLGDREIRFDVTKTVNGDWKTLTIRPNADGRPTERERRDWINGYRTIMSEVLSTFQRQICLFKYSGPRKMDFLRLNRLVREHENLFKNLTEPEKVAVDAFEVQNLRTASETLGLTMDLVQVITSYANFVERETDALAAELLKPDVDLKQAFSKWTTLRETLRGSLWNNEEQGNPLIEQGKSWLEQVDGAFQHFLATGLTRVFSQREADLARRPLDHKKFLDMLIDELEEKYIELLDGTRAHTANVDNYLKRLTTALDDDFNTQFYYPTFRQVREASQFYDVQFGQTETTSILANNREFAKVEPGATMEFDLPKRDILLTEGLKGAKALMNDVGALANDPSFLAMAKMKSPNSGSSPGAGSTSGFGVVRDVLPGLSTATSEQVLAQNANGGAQFGANLENLIPDPAIYKFETGTGFEIRPVVQPDGQAVVFHFNYMYSTNIREPVRADEKHLGRVKRHYVDTDVQLSNFELREVSRYTVALKAARTSRGVPLLEDAPVVGALFRPLPSDEKSLQQNLIMAQATIFPTLFDLMGLRWAPAVADLDPLRLSNTEFVVRNRNRVLKNRVYDEASSYVDTFLRIPEAERRMDLYRSQETVPALHPNGYQGPGLNLRDSELQEGYQPNRAQPQEKFYPGQSREGAPFNPARNHGVPPGTRVDSYPLEEAAPQPADPPPMLEVPQSSSRRRLMR